MDHHTATAVLTIALIVPLGPGSVITARAESPVPLDPVREEVDSPAGRKRFVTEFNAREAQKPTMERDGNFVLYVDPQKRVVSYIHFGTLPTLGPQTRQRQRLDRIAAVGFALIVIQTRDGRSAYWATDIQAGIYQPFATGKAASTALGVFVSEEQQRAIENRDEE